MSARVQAPHVVVGVPALGFILLAGLLIAHGRWLLPAAAVAVLGVLVMSFIEQRTLLALLTFAVLLQPPLGDAGPLPDVKLAEILVPLMLFSYVVQSLVRPGVARPRSEAAPIPAPWRAIHVSVAVYAVVLALNFLRSKLLLETSVDAGVDRVFYTYFIALGVYVLVYVGLTASADAMPRMLRLLFGLSLVMCVAGVTAVVLGLPLNLGDLRYQIYDYASGGVRVGFLETFGIVGLALMTVRAVRYPLATSLIFAAAVFASGGRAAALGIVLAMAAYLLISRKGLQLLVIAVAALVVALAFPSLQSNPQVQRLSEINAQEFEADGRTFIYEESLRAFAGNPVAGTGVGLPQAIFVSDRGEAEYYEAQLSVGGHATYASLLKNFGLLGFLPFCAALGLALWRLGRRAGADPVAGFFFIFLAAQVVSMFAGGNGSDPVVFFGLAGAAACLRRGEAPADELSAGPDREAAVAARVRRVPLGTPAHPH